MTEAMSATAQGVQSDAADRPRAGLGWLAAASPTHADDPAADSARDLSEVDRYATRGIVLAVVLALPIWCAVGFVVTWLLRS